MTPALHRIDKTFNRLGLTWFCPVVRLVGGDEPSTQIRAIASQIGLPILGIAIFLGLWAVIAPQVKTPIGTLPTPGEVWQAGAQLRAEYRADRQARRDFVVKEAEKKLKWEKRFPGRPYAVTFFRSGNPTYLDQIFTSLKTVFFGFLIASCIAVPIGIICGMSKGFFTAINPFIQVLKPVSPLAWLPLVTIGIGAAMTNPDPLLPKSFVISALVVALCSLWPTLINTALGVASVDKDFMNVARVLQLGPWKRVTKIIIPSALPLIFTGLRLSLSVGWMVLIAAEMLSQNPGLGKFVWDMFQNGSSKTLAMIVFAVFTIGIVGFVLDRLMVALQRMVSYDLALAN
jgi:nitrate/nitrite transport system permease protein